jgi:hypothetical protein
VWLPGRPGLQGEDLEVVVENDVLLDLRAAGVASNDGPAVEDFDRLHTDADVEPPGSEAHGHRVLSPAHVHAALAVDPEAVDPEAVELRLVEGFGRERSQGLGLEREVLR